MTINVSLKVLSATWNSICTVARGAASWKLATINWNSGRGRPFNFSPGASSQILRKLASGMALDKALVSVSLSVFNSPKSRKK